MCLSFVLPPLGFTSPFLLTHLHSSPPISQHSLFMNQCAHFELVLSGVILLLTSVCNISVTECSSGTTKKFAQLELIATIELKNTVCLQMNGSVSKVNNKFISHLTRAQRTPSAAATVPSFSCATSGSLFMLTAGPRGQFTRWRRSRKRPSVCYVLRCPDL